MMFLLLKEKTPINNIKKTTQYISFINLKKKTNEM